MLRVPASLCLLALGLLALGSPSMANPAPAEYDEVLAWLRQYFPAGIENAELLGPPRQGIDKALGAFILEETDNEQIIYRTSGQRTRRQLDDESSSYYANWGALSKEVWIEAVRSLRPGPDRRLHPRANQTRSHSFGLALLIADGD